MSADTDHTKRVTNSDRTPRLKVTTTSSDKSPTEKHSSKKEDREKKNHEQRIRSKKQVTTITSTLSVDGLSDKYIDSHSFRRHRRRSPKVGESRKKETSKSRKRSSYGHEMGDIIHSSVDRPKSINSEDSNSSGHNIVARSPRELISKTRRKKQLGYSSDGDKRRYKDEKVKRASSYKRRTEKVNKEKSPRGETKESRHSRRSDARPRDIEGYSSKSKHSSTIHEEKKKTSPRYTKKKRNTKEHYRITATKPHSIISTKTTRTTTKKICRIYQR
eukprot:TRINITY_DN2417_c0_g5_i1.p1 TRINITY_DN2417_c0_g5~~TRINITY_DN2417_c0_g5_i1.p1  ORF type:complete len:274 (+),score=35.61 TRINITY_DN2417_c0_g5_i1:41-862(+)